MDPQDALIATADPAARQRLQRLQTLVREVAPDAEGTVSYKMPAFRQGRIFIYFWAFKNHVGVYPPLTDDPELIAELAPYRGPKGNLKFPHSEVLPEALLVRVVAALHKQYAR